MKRSPTVNQGFGKPPVKNGLKCHFSGMSFRFSKACRFQGFPVDASDGSLPKEAARFWQGTWTPYFDAK